MLIVLHFFLKKKGTIDETSAFAVGVPTIANKTLMMCLQFPFSLISCTCVMWEIQQADSQVFAIAPTLCYSSLFRIKDCIIQQTCV